MAINENGVQVERQYIGARYVPKFFQGVNGSPEWVAGLAYEALTIVTYLGNSFTSKVPVPAGVGNPADNPMYWVNTGNFNAQISEINKQIATLTANFTTQLNNETNNRIESDNAIESEISKINYIKNIILMGDSYSEQNSWQEILVQRLNLSSSRYVLSQLNGGGFTSTTNNFTAKIKEILNTQTPVFLSNLTHIVVCGGANDAQSYASIPTGITEFCAFVKTKAPNAKVYIGFIGWNLNSDLRYNYSQALQKYSECGLAADNAIYLTNVQWIMHNRNLFKADGLHPNEEGKKQLGVGIYSSLITGNLNVIRTIQGVNIGNPARLCFEMMVNGECTISMTNATTFTFDTPVRFTNSVPNKILDVEMHYTSGQKNYVTSGTQISFSVNNQATIYSGCLIYSDNAMWIFSQQIIENISSLKIGPFNIKFTDLN